MKITEASNIEPSYLKAIFKNQCLSENCNCKIHEKPDCFILSSDKQQVRRVSVFLGCSSLDNRWRQSGLSLEKEEKNQSQNRRGNPKRWHLIYVFFYVEGVLLLSFYFSIDKNVTMKKICARNNFTISFPVSQNCSPKLQFS